MDTPDTVKAYGFQEGDDDCPSPLELSEVTFVANAATLRRVAEFLIHAAELLEQHGTSFGHEHFVEFCGGLPDGSSDVIVSSRPVPGGRARSA